MSRRNPFHPVTRGYSLFSVVEVLGRERGLHRVPIVDNERKLVHMVTQSQLVDLLARNLENIGSIKDKPASAICSSEVVTISENSLAIDAFKVMTEKVYHCLVSLPPVRVFLFPISEHNCCSSFERCRSP